MPSNAVSLLLLCMFFMHACNARPLGVSSFRFEDQKMQRGHSESGSEVDIERETRESSATSKAMEHEASSAGNEAIVSRSSDQINSLVTEWKTIMRRQVGEVKAETGPRYGTVDDNTMDSVDGDVREDVVVMDYAQPHRKPPIHNEKP